MSNNLLLNERNNPDITIATLGLLDIACTMYLNILLYTQIVKLKKLFLFKISYTYLIYI